MSSLLLGAVWLLFVMSCFVSMTPISRRKVRIRVGAGGMNGKLNGRLGNLGRKNHQPHGRQA